MSRFKLGVCTLALAALAGAASASEPMPLTETQLDAVTAGTVGIAIGALATSGPAEAFALDGRNNAGQLFTLAGAQSETGAAEGQIGGNVKVRGNGFFTATTGVFEGRTKQAGDGQAFVDAEGVILDGQTLVTPRTYTKDLGPNEFGGRDSLLIVFGASLNNGASQATQ